MASPQPPSHALGLTFRDTLNRCLQLVPYERLNEVDAANAVDVTIHDGSFSMTWTPHTATFDAVGANPRDADDHGARHDINRDLDRRVHTNPGKRIPRMRCVGCICDVATAPARQDS